MYCFDSNELHELYVQQRGEGASEGGKRKGEEGREAATATRRDLQRRRRLHNGNPGGRAEEGEPARDAASRAEGATRRGKAAAGTVTLVGVPWLPVVDGARVSRAR